MAQPKIGSVCHKHVTLLYYMKESSNRNRFSRPQICHPIPQSCHPIFLEPFCCKRFRAPKVY